VRFTDIGGSETSSGRSPWTASVPVRWRLWKFESPMSHSWSIGSSFTIVNVIGTPAGTSIVLGSKRE